MKWRFFFDKSLRIPVVIDDLFYLGQTIVVEFQCAADRRQILKNKNQLNNQREYNRVFINEYTPIYTAEKRRRERHIIQQLEEVARSENTEIKVEYTAAGLTIQGQPYKKKILPPTPRELVNLDLDELEVILTAKMNKGKVIMKERSRFQAYTADVTTHQQIRQYYMKLKLTMPEARHIVCAYIIPGQLHICKDFQDDGEPGSGRVLLQLMEQLDLKNKVIFVVRKYGGIKIGAARFLCYKQAASSALEDPMNISAVSVEASMEQQPPATRNHRQPRRQQYQHTRNNQNSTQCQRNIPQPPAQNNQYADQPQSWGGYYNQPRHQRGSQRGYYRGNQPLRRPFRSTQQMRQPSRYHEMMSQNQYGPAPHYTFANPTNVANVPPHGNSWENMYDENNGNIDM